jgi:branched-chain amino acid transport system permease protein
MDFFWHVLFLIANWIPTVLSYNLIFGKGKILHFGPLGVVIVSAYGTFVVLGWTGSYLLGILAGFVAALIIASLFAWLSLRLEPDGLGIMSIAVHLMLLAIVLNWTSVTRGALGIPRIPRLPILDTLPEMAVMMTIIAILWIAFMWWIDRGSIGRKIAALAEHEWHAKALGVSRMRITFFVFFLSAVAATIVTTTYVPYLRLLHPNDYLFPSLILYVMFVVAGKPGSVFGVSAALALLLTLKEALRFVPLSAAVLGPVRLILFGLILFGAVWWRRDSLFPPQRSV